MAQAATTGNRLMDRYLLNIALLESSIISDGRKIRAEDALETVRHAVWAMFDYAGHVAAHAVHESETETVLIVEVTTSVPFSGRIRALADALCSMLRLEAIAVVKLSEQPGLLEWGDLRGPMAERMGGFSKANFLMLDGSKAVKRNR